VNWAGAPTARSHRDAEKRGVVIQEISHVISHSRGLVRFADQGYVAVAPAIFDRIERNSSPLFARRGGDRVANSSPIRTEKAMLLDDPQDGHRLDQGCRFRRSASSASASAAAVAYAGGDQDVGSAPRSVITAASHRSLR